MKKVISMLLTALLVISMGITGFAEESGIKVILDGKSVSFSDAKPMEKNGRVMVPFAAIFEAMGATVKTENKKVVATLGEKEIRLTEGSTTGELVTNGKTELIDMKVPSFVQNGRTYVPVSTISLGFGFDVYWDDKTDTVNVINAQKLIDEMNAKYTIYNGFMNSEKIDLNKTYKTDMNSSFDMNIDKEVTGDNIDMALAATATMEALTKDMNISAKGNIKVDTVKSNITDSLGEDEKTLENIPFEIIMNTDEGKLFLNMPILTGNENAKDTWIELSIDSMTAAAFDQIKTGMSGQTDLTIGEIVYQMAWGMRDSLSYMDMNVYSYVKEMEKVYDLVIADELFKTTTQGDTKIYTVDMTKTSIIARAMKVYGISETNTQMKEILDEIDKLDYNMVIKEKDGKLVDVEMIVAMAMKFGEETISMDMRVTGNEKDSDMNITLAMGKSKIVIDFKTVTVETNQTVKTTPPAGAEIIDLTSAVENNLAESNIAVIGGADGPTSVYVETK